MMATDRLAVRLVLLRPLPPVTGHADEHRQNAHRVDQCKQTDEELDKAGKIQQRLAHRWLRVKYYKRCAAYAR